jgi:protein AIR1/2
MEDGLSDSDSRTFVVGRKRDLQDICQYREAPAMGSQSSDEEASRLGTQKRRKANHKESGLSLPGDAMKADAPRAQLAKGQVTSREDGEVLETPESASSPKSAPTNATNMNEEGAEIISSLTEAKLIASAPTSKPDLSTMYEHPSLVQGNTQAIGWNRGVQPGLRTSFGNKKQMANFVDRKVSIISNSHTPSHSMIHDNGGEINKSESDHIESDKPQQDDGRAGQLPNPQGGTSLQENTSKVESVLLHEKVWPLPEQHRDLMKLVYKGQTHYPTKSRDWESYKLKGTNEEAEMTLMLNDEGLPYKVTDFSYNIWILQFLKMNLVRLHMIRKMKPGQLQLAFKSYISSWYRHVEKKKHKQRLYKAATSAKAWTVEQAIAIYNANIPGAINHRKASLPNAVQDLGMTKSVHDHQQRNGSSSSTQNDNHRSVPANDAVKSANSEVSRNIPSKNAGSTSRATDVTRPSPVIISSVSTSSKSSDEDIDMGSVSSTSRASASAFDARYDSVVEMTLQRKYFPGDSMGSSIHRCLACGDSGHWHNDCAALNCSVCGEQGRHSDFTCPKNQPCSKCSQRGHTSSHCPEKLRATRTDMGACTICSDKNHLDLDCHFVWRSFAPRPEDIRTVGSIPIHCYTCGATGHYGPECGLHSGRLLTGGYTWSRLNIAKYVDISSQARAVSAGVDYAPKKPPSKDFSIKGKGKASDPFTIEDSDGEEDFIRRKPNTATGQRGHIHFAQPFQNQPNHYDERPHPDYNQGYRPENLKYHVAVDRSNYDMDHNYHGESRPSKAEYPAFARSENLASTETQMRYSDKAPRKKTRGKGGPHVGPPKVKKQKQAPPAVNKKPRKTKKIKKREAEAKQARNG